MKLIQSITKIFNFSMGHRLSNYGGACRRLHGHNYELYITLSSKKLDSLGMVVDFNKLKNIYKEFIEPAFDHKMLLNKNDTYNKNLAKALPDADEVIVFVDYNPTVENIAKHIASILQNSLSRLDIKVSKIKLYETPTSYTELVYE